MAWYLPTPRALAVLRTTLPVSGYHAILVLRATSWTSLFLEPGTRAEEIRASKRRSGDLCRRLGSLHVVLDFPCRSICTTGIANAIMTQY